MSYPDVVPFLENATNRERREELSRLFNNRAADTNTALLAEAVALRERVAELFGRPSWAHHTMDEKMAHDPETVDAFYEDLVPSLTKKATEEIAVMAARLAADVGDDDLQLWDWRYYDTTLRKTEYGVDLHAVAAYFPLQQVLDGMLEITGEVFGLEYRPIDVPVWHPDVRSFTIIDRATGADVAVVHMDLHPREGKFSHAAAFDLVPGRRLADGSYRTPVSAIVANFTKPTGDRPSLLLHDEVVTLFHEFGHILHQTLTRAETVRFSGTSTERDFVEAPSQIMEHWCWRPEVLNRFARHHETGEPIPAAVVEQLVAARDLNVGVVNLRQVQFGVLDMGFHGPRRPEDGTDARRRARPGGDPAAGGVGRPLRPRRRDVHAGELRPPPRRLRRRVLRLPLVEGLRRRHVQQVRRRGRHQPGGRAGVPGGDPREGRVGAGDGDARGLPRPAAEQRRVPRRAGHRVTSTDAAVARRAIGLLDLTDLGAETTADAAAALCERAAASAVAAVCVWPAFVDACARRLAGSGVRVATVVNFPAGTDPARRRRRGRGQRAGRGRRRDRRRAAVPGVAQRRHRGRRRRARRRARGDRGAGDEGDHRVGRAARPVERSTAPRCSPSSAAPTSSRPRPARRPVSATPEAAEIILEAINVSGRPVGFKASGGIRTLADARTYLDLADSIMGPDWATPGHVPLRRQQPPRRPRGDDRRRRPSPAPTPARY